jgi:hypothetical protein
MAQRDSFAQIFCAKKPPLFLFAKKGWLSATNVKLRGPRGIKSTLK